ncbi:hypothetical protein C2845_PM05G05900 [Panicum miliaceum]|uniref:RING-type domain-containing protein n=1 Tax=Panicum miliaceum TaxID=4540 RepID=A0A3L6SXN9_PANMI|nr:hypothetical protein C2845_PM05G05900 [Panicum miliaceum]
MERDADASRMVGQQEQPPPPGSTPPQQGHGAPSDLEPPASPDSVATTAHPRRPHVEAMWQLARELDRRGIHVPIFSIVLRRAAERRGTGQESQDDAYRNGGFGAVPASGEAIASLPETTVTVVESDECAVCFESYEEGDSIRTMPCSHGFHEGCIVKWLGISRLCPLY